MPGPSSSTSRRTSSVWSSARSSTRTVERPPRLDALGGDRVGVDVELVEWTRPIPIGVAGGPVPGSVPAGEGRGTGGVLPLVASGLLLLVVAGAQRTGRGRALARP